MYSVFIYNIFPAFSAALALVIILLRFLFSSKLYTTELPVLLLVFGSEQCEISFFGSFFQLALSVYSSDAFIKLA